MKDNEQLNNNLIQFIKDKSGAADERKITVKNYIKDGANINAQDSVGKTALHYAVLNGEISLVKYLVQTFKAKPNIKDNDNKIPSDYANNAKAYSNRMIPFFDSLKTSVENTINNKSFNADNEINKLRNIITKGSLSDLRNYLLYRKENIIEIINQPISEGVTALEFVIKRFKQKYFEEKLIALLDVGADYTVSQYEEGSFINFVIKHSFQFEGKLIKYCLEKRLFKINNTKSYSTLPPLCYLFSLEKSFTNIEKRNKGSSDQNLYLIKVIKLFTDNGIDINERDKNGNTALNYILNSVFKKETLNFEHYISLYNLIEFYPNIELNPSALNLSQINKFFLPFYANFLDNSYNYNSNPHNIYFIKVLNFVVKKNVKLEEDLFKNLYFQMPFLTKEIDNIKELQQNIENACNAASRLNKVRFLSKDPIAAFSEVTNIPTEIIKEEILPFVANHQDGSIIYNILKNDHPSSKEGFVKKYLESKNSPSQTTAINIQDNANLDSKKSKIR